MQETAEHPFPYQHFPTGWFAVLPSRELEAGAVKPIHYFGTDLVLYRTESGKAVVTNPFCPHLGAHLGYGGTVEGDTIRCPFHHWKFDATGRCTSRPFAPGVNRPILKIWPTAEHNDVIFVWYDAEGRPPSWEMPDFEPVRDQDMLAITAYEGMKTFPQEVLENGADWLHFVTVHETQQLDGEVDTKSVGPHNLLFQYWTKSPDGSKPKSRGLVDFYGPGYARNLSFGERWPKVTVDHSVYVTPIDRGTLTIFSLRRLLPAADCDMPAEAMRQLSVAVEAEVRRQLELDVVIWEKKAYMDRPILSPADGPILKYRQWYRQFYPDGPAAAAKVA
jgi:3-ketosteroid 9alpha-monooxygenase subunit A